MKVTTVGLDLAKQVFSVHGVDEHGKAVLRKRVSRGKLLELFAQLPPGLVGMEACSGAHHWARELERLGHRVGVMAARFVAPYRKSEKNDGNDAEAICEAVGRPSMRFVAVKSAEQQALLVLHRVRQGFSAERTATINQLRGLLAEFGVVLPKGRYQLRAHIQGVLEDAENAIPGLARRAFAELNAHIGELDQKILAYDRELEALARASEPAQRLQQIPGIGPITATALVASVADAKSFRASSPRGWAWCHASTPPAGTCAWGESPSAATCTCERCSSTAPGRCSAAPRTSPIGSAAGPKRFARDAACARPPLRWRRRTPESPGRCSPMAMTTNAGSPPAERRA